MSQKQLTSHSSLRPPLRKKKPFSAESQALVSPMIESVIARLRAVETTNCVARA